MKPFVGCVGLGLAKADEKFALIGSELGWREIKGGESGAIRKGDWGLTSAGGTNGVLGRKGSPIRRICWGSVAPLRVAWLFWGAGFRGGRSGSS